MTTAPERFSVAEDGYKEKALKSFILKGSVILTDIFPNDDESWKMKAEEVPSLLFHPSDLRLSKHKATGVHIEHHGFRAGKITGSALAPHTDGYVWGDCNPDIVVLLCEKPAAGEGGQNYLIDGESIATTPDRFDKDTLQILEEVRFDHTERPEHGFESEGIESITPIFRWEESRKLDGWLSTVEKKRFRWRRMVHFDFTKGERNFDAETYMSCWKEIDGKSHHNDALRTLDREIFKEMKDASRFQLREGDALIIDNFRMLHAREAYNENDHTDPNLCNRRMWRVWSWTFESEGLPPCMTEDEQATTVTEADILINQRNHDGIKVS